MDIDSLYITSSEEQLLPVLITSKQKKTDMQPNDYIKWIQLIVNAFALGAAGWIYKAYILNLQSSLSSKDDQIKAVEKNMNLWRDKAAELEKKSPAFMEEALNKRIKIREDEIIRLGKDKETHVEEIKIQEEELARLKSELEKTKDYKMQLSFVGDDFDDYFFSRKGELEIEEVGIVAVDSGQLMITDPSYIDTEWEKEEFEDIRLFKDKDTKMVYQYRKDFDHYHETISGFHKNVNELIAEGKLIEIETSSELNYSYRGACAATLSENGFGELKFKLGQEGAGVAFRTVAGDGIYPVYAEKYNGKAIRVYVNLV